MREKNYQIALGGVLSALALALMGIGSLFPFGTFAVPAAASLCIMIIDEELHAKTALLTYLSVSILSMLIAADKEAALIFAGIAGYYPVLKRILETRFHRFTGTVLKFAIFNAAILGIYLVLIRLFFPASLGAEMETYTTWMVAVLLVMGNLVFFLMDVVLGRMRIIYRLKWRSRFIRNS